MKQLISILLLTSMISSQANAYMFGAGADAGTETAAQRMALAESLSLRASNAFARFFVLELEKGRAIRKATGATEDGSNYTLTIALGSLVAEVGILALGTRAVYKLSNLTKSEALMDYLNASDRLSSEIRNVDAKINAMKASETFKTEDVIPYLAKLETKKEAFLSFSKTQGAALSAAERAYVARRNEVPLRLLGIMVGAVTIVAVDGVFTSISISLHADQVDFMIKNLEEEIARNQAILAASSSLK
jgi:ABC-type antimicrobial peptide transport system permease subunit